jgi:hypothetical protein
MLSLLPLLLAATVATTVDSSSVTYTLLESPTRHVRTTDPSVARLLRRGVSRSGTFAGLISHLNASDVIVYIEVVPTLPATLAGRLLLMPMSNHQRYLRIQMALKTTPNDLIATIGHELRHAIEVADSPDVRSDADLERLYERIGVRSHNAHCYETTAAQTTARVVRRELVA